MAAVEHAPRVPLRVGMWARLEHRLGPLKGQTQSPRCRISLDGVGPLRFRPQRIQRPHGDGRVDKRCTSEPVGGDHVDIGAECGAVFEQPEGTQHAANLAEQTPQLDREIARIPSLPALKKGDLPRAILLSLCETQRSDRGAVPRAHDDVVVVREEGFKRIFELACVHPPSLHAGARLALRGLRRT